MQAAHYSSLLPDVFRHKTTKVKIFQPQIVLIDFHGTISERRWEDKVIFPYIQKALADYLKDNWTNEEVQKCLPGLKNESFEQRFRHKHEDVNVIEDYSEELDPGGLMLQVAEFLKWQMINKRETRETQTIGRLVWVDGYKRKQISTPIYDDVMNCLKRWHDQHNCATYIISSTDSETLKLLLSGTDKGNLDQFITGYIGSKKYGDKLMTDTYKQFFEQANLKLPSKVKSPNNNGSSSKSLSSKTIKSTTSSEILAPKPVLFITDSGQEAKAANMAMDGQIYECILINRPGNKRIRTYYLSQFPFVDKFEDIEFV